MLTVLTDHDVNTILHSLTKDDILEMQQSLADALHYYSTSGEENLCCSSYQPMRTALKRKDGKTTLFMPASANTGLGIKVVTIGGPGETDAASVAKLSISSKGSGSPRGSMSSSSSSAPVQPPASIASSQSTTPRGSMTLFDSDGSPTALINAEELTGFRTALASTMLLRKRQSVHDVTIFGAGKQAYWHARIALLLRGDEIHHLNVVNRSFDRARELMIRLYNPMPGNENYVNPIGPKYNSKTKTAVLTPSSPEYTRLLKGYVRSANVIFCTTPSTEPLFPASYLTNPEGRKKGRYISLIGSYKPHMLELHPDVLKAAVAPHTEHRHFHRHQREGGAVVVDSVEACLQEAGEIIQAKIKPEEVVELGELVMLKRDAERRRAEGHAKDDKGTLIQESSGLHDWLSKGNVIYKSVGIGLMDVICATELVRLAREKSIGTVIPDF